MGLFVFFSGCVDLFAGLASILSEGRGSYKGNSELLGIWARCGTNRFGQRSSDIRKFLGENIGKCSRSSLHCIFIHSSLSGLGSQICIRNLFGSD